MSRTICNVCTRKQPLSKVDGDDKEQVAKSRLSQTATVSDIEIEQLSQVTVDNLNGYDEGVRL